MSQTQIQTQTKSQTQTSEKNKLEELIKRVKVIEKAVNEVLPFIEELDDQENPHEADERIAKILELAVPGLEYFNLFEHHSIEEGKAIIKIYEKYFPGWMDDECTHYLLVKLADDKYVIIYSCSDLLMEEKKRFEIAVNGEPVE